MTTHDLAYLGGLIDGEGCITAMRRKDSRSTRVLFSVAMCDRTLLEWAAGLFEGKVYEKNQSINRWHNWDQCYTWVASDKAALKILRKVLPYLRLKTRQAVLAIELGELKATGRPKHPADLERQYALVAEIQSLNKKGRLP